MLRRLLRWIRRSKVPRLDQVIERKPVEPGTWPNAIGRRDEEQDDV